MSTTGVTFSSKGYVYVADTDNDRVQKFDGNGTFITKWGGRGTGNGKFLGPASIAVDNNGTRVYIADSGNSRVQVFIANP
ncbi:MAG: 6-bladed beta-propeller [Nitrososphaeraceae archaeon]